MISDHGTQGTYERVYIALGSNIGNREEWLQKALRKLQDLPDVRALRCSSIYETEPVGYTDQGAFLNMVAVLDIAMSVTELFSHMMNIEQQLDRRRDIHWGPRTIDLDLIMVGNMANRIEAPDLIVPHPRAKERAFVLIPLLDVLDRQHPDYDRLHRMVASLPDREGVEVWRICQSRGGSEPFAN